jgi:uncharacterized protein
MMLTLCVTSLSEHTGKTLLCAGLGKFWTEKSKKIGYLKPLFSDTKNQTVSVDRDIIFMQKLLDLKESIDLIGPVTNNQNDSEALIKQAYSQITAEKDIVLIEGSTLNMSLSMIEALDAKVLVIHDYPNSLSASLAEYRKIGTRLMGIVINKVPKNQMDKIKSRFLPDLETSGINLLGVVPEDRLLMSMSVNDLAEAIQGKILNSADNAGEIIENFMMGSSTFDRGPAYYNRKNNKAVILWGERPGFRKAALAGLQSAALQTSVKCIVISNNGVPIPAAAQKAEEKQIPFISAGGDLTSLVIAIEKGMSSLKFNQAKKMPQLLELLSQNLNSQLLSWS